MDSRKKLVPLTMNVDVILWNLSLKYMLKCCLSST